jgi:hypothetical protein
MAKRAPPGNTPRKAAAIGGPAMATSAARRTDTLLAVPRAASQPAPPMAGTGADAPPAPRAPEPARHPYGPRPLGALMPAITRAAFKRRSPAAAQLLLDWGQIVGPGLAACAIPKRLVGTTLTLACSGPAALELQHLSAALIGRINTHLGRVAVEHLRFVQDGAPPAVVPPPPRPPPVAIADMPDGDLRDALSRLGGAVAGRRR